MRQPELLLEPGAQRRGGQADPHPAPPPSSRRTLDEPPALTPGTAARPRRMEGRHQGVLWKRRDVFKNRWRPRWFVLQPGQGILTYYLLSGDATSVPDPIVSSSTASSGSGPNSLSPHRLQQQQHALPSSPDELVSSPSVVAFDATLNLSSSSSHHQHPRDRTTSWDSRASENTLDYDVVPRGTIYLLGCAVRINDELTRPADQLYCLTIDPPTTTESQIHLAARTPEQRELWVSKIAAVCNASAGPATTPAPAAAAASAAGPRGRPSDTPIRSSTTRTRSTSATPASQTLTPTRPSIRPIPEHRALHSPPIDSSRSTTSTPGRRSLSESNLQSPLVQPVAGVPDVPSSVGSTEPPEPSPHAWKSLSRVDRSSLYANVNDDTVRRLEAAIQSGLEDATKGDSAEPEWKALYRHPKAAAFRRRRGNSSSSSSSRVGTIKVEATLPYPIKHVFELLVDASRLVDAEGRKAVRDGRAVRQLNPHTSIDFLSYHGSWPTDPIDLAVVTHWQVLEKEGGERAVCVVSVSCPEASAATRDDSPSPAIRGEVVLCWTLLRQRSAADGPSRDECQLTRFFSVDPGPSVPPKIVGTFLNQRANLPVGLSSYIGSYEPTPEARHKLVGPLTDDQLIRDIIRRLDETRKRAAERRRRASSKMARLGELTLLPDDSSDGEGGQDIDKDFYLPPLDQQAFLLCVPLVVYTLAIWSRVPPSPSFWFAAALYYTLRELALLHIGPPVSQPESSVLLGSVTCRFKIDLKGVLRLISNKKEEREELKRGTADVTILHIVACAFATALKKERTLCTRRIAIPWLCIDRLVQGDAEAVSVTFVSEKENGFQVVTLDRIDPNVQQVADDVQVATDSCGSSRKSIGTCLIVASPNVEQVEMETEVLPLHPNVRMVCSIGGVNLMRSVEERSWAIGRQTPRPYLSLSLTVINTGTSDFGACRRLAEDIQTLLRFPEMCDD